MIHLSIAPSPSFFLEVHVFQQLIPSKLCCCIRLPHPNTTIPLQSPWVLYSYNHPLPYEIAPLFHSSYAIIISFRSPYLFYPLVHSRCRGFLFSLDHTQTHITVGRTPLDEGSAHCRDHNTNTVQETNIHAPGGIRTHDPSRRSAADLRLRSRGHWDRRNYNIPRIINLILFTPRIDN
jgi:hypothetical protein